MLPHSQHKAGTFDAKKEIEEVGFSRIEMKQMTVKELPAMLSRFVFGTVLLVYLIVHPDHCLIV